MRIFLHPARRTCIVCERPAPSSALVCAYCGEDLPQRRQLLCQRAGITAVALFTTAAFAAVHGRLAFPAKLTLPGAALMALGAGLALLPPKLHGVAGGTRAERLRQVAPRFFGGIALALVTALTVLTAGAPKPWPLADVALAAAATLALLAAPPSLRLPWYKLVAGVLLAAGLLLSR